MIQGHPQGAGPLVGRQRYYLVKSEHGWLGGVGFSSSALPLGTRDRWIGWDWDTRRANLYHVVNMRQFMMRPGVSCKNLASRVLGLVVREFSGDFEARYGHRLLLLESFADTSHHTGACCRAANWQYLGRTKDRGRQDVLRKREESVKDVYGYPLDEHFRVKMGLPEDSGLDAIEIADGREWVKKEFGGEHGWGIRGFHLHSTFAVTSSGLPLRALRADLDYPCERRETPCRYEGGRMVFVDDN